MKRPRDPRWYNGYPTGGGKPIGETDWHRDVLLDLIDVLKRFYQDQPLVYVSGWLWVYYVPGNRRRRVAPDVFVVKGVPNYDRPNYLVWEEGKGPDVVIEITSRKTRHEDLVKKFDLYQNTFQVKEYFLFDVLGDYLDPPLRGYRLRKGVYQPIRAVHGRLPSQVLGLHLERDGKQLRLHDPSTGPWLPTPQEAQQWAEQAQQRAEAEVERLRRENEELRRRMSEEK
ncbi:MAG: Uma2 family endonuclease [Planctomycetes bacterium]|nr:Uma2 family endonuclease [Planctomycetota bacterium]